MGTWTIRIDGHGSHHNDRADDADAIARKLVRELSEAGHTVKRADFTLTNSTDQLDAK